METALPTSHTNFNPRTPVGCDCTVEPQYRFSFLFQSTHPSGVRLGIESVASVAQQFQSTHPSGVRPQSFKYWRFIGSFQSTHPSGVRRVTVSTSFANCSFQSTHPSGVRRHSHLGAKNVKNFNPRTPVGCDEKPLDVVWRSDNISIHAPQWGATLAFVKY